MMRTYLDGGLEWYGPKSGQGRGFDTPKALRRLPRGRHRAL